jgi:hypothetical protein
VVAFPKLGARFLVSTDGGSEPIWGRDGRLYYRHGQDFVVATIRTSPSFTVVRREVILSGSYPLTNGHANYDVMPGGQLVLPKQKGVATTAKLLVLNWAREVDARLRDAR